jgi:hypothetical protein
MGFIVEVSLDTNEKKRGGLESGFWLALRVVLVSLAMEFTSGLWQYTYDDLGAKIGIVDWALLEFLAARLALRRSLLLYPT